MWGEGNQGDFCLPASPQVWQCLETLYMVARGGGGGFATVTWWDAVQHPTRHEKGLRVPIAAQR